MRGTTIERFLEDYQDDLLEAWKDPALVRLFRRHGRYYGRLHEQVVDRVTGDLVTGPQVPAVELAHSGYTDLRFAAKDKVARNLKITQQAVSKRKRKIICKLRHLLREARTALLVSGTLFWSSVTEPIELLLSCDLWL